MVDCNHGNANTKNETTHEITVTPQQDLSGYSKVYFASGCFWCVEAIFESVKGVEEVISGYAGGQASTATYPQVSAGSTKHAETVEVYFDPELISYEALLEVFFGSHDPTTLNRQGPDRGTQYRSAIFYQNEEEKRVAQEYINMLEEKEVYDKPIVTTLESFEAFYPAEAYHQNYEERNPNQPYVKSVSTPRLNRFKVKFPEYLKEGKKH